MGRNAALIRCFFVQKPWWDVMQPMYDVFSRRSLGGPYSFRAGVSLYGPKVGRKQGLYLGGVNESD